MQTTAKTINLKEMLTEHAVVIENLQTQLNALADDNEMLKISANVERELRLKMIKNAAQALGIYIYDDRIEVWLDDPEFINAGTIDVYRKL